MNVKKTKKFKENRPENYHVHDNCLKFAYFLLCTVGETKERVSHSLGTLDSGVNH